MGFVREAGWPIFLVLTLGVSSLAAALRYWTEPRRELFVAVIGLGSATLIFGLLGTVLGVQMSASHIGEVPNDMKWIFILGLKESLYNLSTALVFAFIDALLLTSGSYKRAASARANLGPSA
jgi:hypothetical protein